MSNIEQSIDVNVPVRTAYDQWTQFEEFPRFMEGVREVRQLDDKRLAWCAEVGGKEKRWHLEDPVGKHLKRSLRKTEHFRYLAVHDAEDESVEADRQCRDDPPEQSGADQQK